MDPLTILAAAQAAYSGIKVGIAAGKEIQHMAKDLSDLWGSLAKLTQISAEKPKPSIFSRKSAEQIAIERYTARAEAQDLAAKAKNMFVGQFGLSAWDQVQREVINIRKEIEREKYEAEKVRAAKLEELREATVVTLIVMFGVAVIFCVGIILMGVSK
jgi:inorganic triphosphatase YgiF